MTPSHALFVKHFCRHTNGRGVVLCVELEPQFRVPLDDDIALGESAWNRARYRVIKQGSLLTGGCALRCTLPYGSIP